MKWLTRAWASGELNDDEYDARWEAYQAHNAAVLPHLDSGAELLVEDVYLHDAQIRSFEHASDNILTIRALIGDLQMGYEFVELAFHSAQLRVQRGADADSPDLLDRDTEIIYHEVDIEPDGRFVHRVLLWPQGEYEVAFAALTVRRTPATPADRHHG